ncbi:hypothetical protein GGX14DRAFT_455126 [Mycena pura]|uniref:RING-type domain-containing protein n=1 Tax=Mycena pura TaxID=153505 RepID=A0AAD6VB69_9AGAR|nr:hypothetical protein GGX14DRAFT_455126 [Mycena pura]
MGQSASRRRPPTPPSAPPDIQLAEQAPTPRPHRPRASTFRNSLLSLVGKRSDGERRASRRWSRAPRPETPPKQEPEDDELIDAADDIAADNANQVAEAPELDTDLPRERAPTPMPPPTVAASNPAPLPPASPTRAFPPPGTLVVVQGVVHTTDILRPPNPSPLALAPTPAPAPPAISSSSIDVLGTLLTVAAQATAASLLTGSSDALLRSPVASNVPSTNAAGTTPRRNPWGALRDRLGPAALPALPPTTAPSSPQDERARMLAEMARAFNLGLGLTPPSQRTLPGVGSNPNVTPDTNTSAPPEAEEGTFERFLIDLQTDLRVALSPEQPGATPAMEGTAVPASEDTSEPHVDARANTADGPIPEIPTQSISSAEPPAPATPDESEGPTPAEPAPEVTSPPVPGMGPGAVNWWRLYRFPPIVAPPRVTPPAPASVSDAASTPPAPASVSEAEAPPIAEASSVTPPSDASSSPTAESPSQPLSLSPPQTVVPVIVVGLQSVQLGSGGVGAMWGGGAVQGVVPMGMHGPMGGSNQGAARTGTGPEAEAGMASEGEAAEGEREEEVYDYEYEHEAPGAREYADAAVEADLDSAGADVGVGVGARAGSVRSAGGDTRTGRRRSWWRPRASRSAVAESPATSVNVGEAHADANAEEEEGDSEEGVHANASAVPDAEEATVGGTSLGGSDTTTGVSADEHGVNPNANHGGVPAPDSSRTFLIYVIGGYYPPEHGILTGAGGAESFEALLELGELWGHVRPPTASKADIERAGLAVLRRDALAGRVTASCAERCLICLDDYEEEDYIRVLSCRHAFHQGCVDRWLETGRNNCPACRSNGVPTEQMPPNVPSPPPQQANASG